MKLSFKNPVLYAVHVLIVRPVLLGVVGVRYRRRSVLPKGPCLVVANHNSHLDAAVLMTMFPLRRVPEIHPVAAADYFSANWFMKMWAMLFLNAIPFDRKPARGRDPLAPVIERLQRGETMIFFPEGSRGEAGVVARFRSGVGLIVKAVPGLLVVPVFLSGPERIWPRGRVVPVPLNIDANIGKPRTYPTDRDPREIADLVRNDVLALAPPPPALPGAPRPRPAQRVAICTIDDGHRAELVRRCGAALAESGPTLSSGDPAHEAGRELPDPISGVRRAWLRLLAALFRTGERFKGERFVEMLDKARLEEALGQARDAQFVLTDGSALVDVVAWSQAELQPPGLDERELARLVQYLLGEKSVPPRAWWRFARRTPVVWLVNALQLVRPPVPDLLVLLRLPVAQLMEDLRRRGERLGPHQNEAFLERLQQSYAQVASLLRKRRHVEVLELDPAEGTLDDAAARIVESCRLRAAAAHAAEDSRTGS